MALDFPNIRHISVFAETERLGSVSRAAESIFLTQPAASQGIAKLEAELGTPLFIRQSGNIVATEAGHVYAIRVRRALELLDAGLHGAARSGGKRSTPVEGNEGARFSYKITAAQLRAFAAVGDAGSFTLAARALDMAQPSIHRRARALEQVVGVPLVRAAPAGVALTAAGQVLFQHIKLAAVELRQGREELDELAGQGAACFVLGTLPLARSVIVPSAVHALVQERDGIQVQVVDGRYDELLRALREGEIDCLIGALRFPEPAEDVTQEPLFDDRLAVICGKNHPLATRSSVTWDDTLNYPWAAPPKPTPTGQFLVGALQIPDLPETPVRVVSSSLLLLRKLLMTGDYVSILSRHQIEAEVASGDIVILPIHLQGERRSIGLTYRNAWEPTEMQRRFLTLLREAARASVAAMK